MMPVSLRLAIRQWRARPLRLVLCGLAIAAAVALVVMVGAGADSARLTAQEAVHRILGAADVHVRNAVHGPGYRVPAAELERLRQQPGAELVSGRMEAAISLDFKDQHRWFPAVGVTPKLNQQLRPQTLSAGRPLSGAPEELVIDQRVAKAMGAAVGDTLTLSGDSGAKVPVHVVGMIEQPQLEFLARPGVLLDAQTLSKITGIPPAYNTIDVKLAPGVDASAWGKRAEALAARAGLKVDATSVHERDEKLGSVTGIADLLLLALSVISGLCAALIVGTTLSVGVQERVRQFGQLRCIGASRGQLVVCLAAEALLLMLTGVALGLAIGVGLSRLTVWLLPHLFLAYAIGLHSVLVAVAAAVVATLAGGAIPAWQVWRVTPMAAVRTTGLRARPGRVWLAAAGGLLLIAIQPILWVTLPAGPVRLYAYLFAGIPLLFAGYCLLGPAILLAVEPLASRVLGAVLRVRPALLKHAWSSTPWRAGAMVAALMIGVTMFVAVNQRAAALEASWLFPARFPDLLLYSLFPTSEQRANELRTALPNVVDPTLLGFFNVPTAGPVAPRGPLVAANHVQYIMIEPERIGQILGLDFVQGERAAALKAVAEGRSVLVSREFATVSGLGVGDHVTLLDRDRKPVTFEIAGVVTNAAMNVAKNYFDVGAAFRDASTTSVAGSIANARKYFVPEPTFNLMLADLSGPPSQAAQHEHAAEEAAQKYGWSIVSSRQLKDNVLGMIGRMTHALSLLAFGALCVASLGVANMVIAAVHARRYEFGVLRAIGAGRGQLVRLVIAETLFIAGAAAALGSLAGLHLAFMASRVDRMMTSFNTGPNGGALSVLATIGIALGATAALAALAAIVPAVRAAFSAQRLLLSTGRG